MLNKYPNLVGTFCKYKLNFPGKKYERSHGHYKHNITEDSYDEKSVRGMYIIYNYIIIVCISFKRLYYIQTNKQNDV